MSEQVTSQPDTGSVIYRWGEHGEVEVRRGEGQSRDDHVADFKQAIMDYKASQSETEGGD